MLDISIVYSRIIARELQLNEKNLALLLVGTSISPEALYQVSSLTLDDFNQLLVNALVISDDLGFGLRFGVHTQPFSTGEVGQAALVAPTLLGGLKAYSDFSRLRANYIAIDMKAKINIIQLTSRDLVNLGETRRTQHEVLILTFQNFIEAILGRPFVEGHYYFSFPEPDYFSRYSDVYHCSFSFDAKFTGLDLPAELSSFKSPFFDQAAWSQVQLHCLQLMDELKSQEKEVYSRYILSDLRSRQPPLPNIVEMARQLNISERTLTRRLHDEGTSYGQLVTHIIKEWCQCYLTQSNLSVETIATLLGYQDSSNFRRAFKRWFGCSPSVYRQLNKQV